MSPAKRQAIPPMPKPDAAAKELFAAVVPEAPDVVVRPMFGNPAAFVNGNMFMGLFGQDLFVRLPEADRDAVAAAGGGPLEPMPGRPMREYTVLPDAWRGERDRLREWASRSLAWARDLPAKQKKK